jgi:hypothetical protein
MTGDEAHALAIATGGLEIQASYEDDDVVLHLLAPTGAESTAVLEGLRTASAD